MVEDHVAPLCNRDAIFATTTSFSHSDAQIPYDCIVSIAETPAVAVYCNAITRCCLPKNGYAFRHDHALSDLNQPTDGEHNDAVGFGNGITERAFTAVVEVGDNVNGTATTTGRVATKTFCTWKGKGSGGSH